jgi:hypothetical protein
VSNPAPLPLPDSQVLHVPTNDVDDEKKDAFYLQLHTILDKTGERDLTIIMVQDFDNDGSWLVLTNLHGYNDDMV